MVAASVAGRSSIWPAEEERPRLRRRTPGARRRLRRSHSQCGSHGDSLRSTPSTALETQFGTNHLGHFVLVNRIAPLIRAGGRLINLASSGHRFSNVDLDDPNFQQTPYDPFVAYGRSKTANILFAVAFDQRRHRGR